MDPKSVAVLGDAKQGVPMEAHLWVCSGENIGRRFELDKPQHLIGRTANIDIPVVDERVSQLHAKVVLQDDGHFVQDLGSTNGTFVNNQPLTGPRKLQDGDLIQVGETVFEYITYERRNLAVTLRGTSQESDSVPATLRAGAQQALNRARQGPNDPPGGGFGHVPTSPNSPNLPMGPIPSGSPYQQSPGLIAFPNAQSPYMSPYADHRGVLLDDDDDEEGGLDLKELIRKVHGFISFFRPYWQLIVALGVVMGILGALSVKLTPPAKRPCSK